MIANRIIYHDRTGKDAAARLPLPTRETGRDRPRACQGGEPRQPLVGGAVPFTDPLGVVSGDGDSVGDGSGEDGAVGDGEGDVGDGDGDGDVGDGDGDVGDGDAECDGDGAGECVGDGAGGVEVGRDGEAGRLGVAVSCWLPGDSSRAAERRK